MTYFDMESGRWHDIRRLLDFSDSCVRSEKILFVEHLDSVVIQSYLYRENAGRDNRDV